jgi:spermidine synthase
MSDTEAEIRDHLTIIYKAKGHVLIHGLGIGMVARTCLLKPEVASVTVVELQLDVIKLVGPWLEDIAAKANKRLTIIQGDAFTWKPPKEQKWDIVWHDVWNEICTDNLPQMSKLHRRFGKRCIWQDSWSRGLLQVYKREERKQEKALEMWR